MGRIVDFLGSSVAAWPLTVAEGGEITLNTYTTEARIWQRPMKDPSRHDSGGLLLFSPGKLSHDDGGDGIFFSPLFTCGRRPAGLLVTRVVVVAGGGDNFYTWAF